MAVCSAERSLSELRRCFERLLCVVVVVVAAVSERILARNPRDEILKAFRLFDDDETGRISLRNMRRVARELGETIGDEELQAMIDEFDRNGDGEIDADEFMSIMTADY